MESRREQPAPDSAVARLLSGLNPAQHTAVISDAAPLCILAGAGSGKTRVLTRRIAYRIARGTADPGRVLAITFTRKAAGELRNRLTQLGVRDRVAAGTFHSIAYAQLRQWWSDTGVAAPSLTQSKIRILAPLLGRSLPPSVQPVDVASEIEWAKARLVGPDAYAGEVERTGRRPPLGAARMADLYERYEAEKRRRRLVDFDDLLLLCGKALERDAEFAARQRWRFRHVFVDEFQDVNPAQHRLLQGWLGDRPDLCVVGDPNQAIYAWNGADPRYLTEFAQRRPGATVLRLDDNYRSTPQILTVADAVLGLGSRSSGPLRPHRADGPLPTVTSFPSDVDEARGVARALRDRHSSRVPWSSMAVLVRTNAQALVFEEALRAAQVPFRVRGAMPFLSLPEVRAALAVLQRAPSESAMASRLGDLDDLVVEARAVLPEGAGGPDGANDRAANLEGLVRLANEFLAADPSGTVAGFLSWLAATITSSADEPDRHGDAVEITTFHKAKGLEWQIVFVTGLERGFVPIAQADNTESWDEERRLLYVAVTRAELELHCTWAQSRTFGARTTNRSASPWLSNVEAAITALRDPGTGDWRSQLRAQRERLAAAKAAGVPGVRGTRHAMVQVGCGADPKVLEALKRWRLTTARATGVPAFVILHDTTLAAVAEARPTNRSALLALPGMGPVKVDRYGDDLLAVVAATARAAS